MAKNYAVISKFMHEADIGPIVNLGYVQKAADAIDELIAEREELVAERDKLAAECSQLKAERDYARSLFEKSESWKCPACAHNKDPERRTIADCELGGKCKLVGGFPDQFVWRNLSEKMLKGDSNSVQ